MTRKHLIALFLTLCLLTSFLQPCLAEETFIPGEPQDVQDVVDPADGQQKVDVDTPVSDGSQTQDIVVSDDVSASTSETASETVSDDLLDNLKGAPENPQAEEDQEQQGSDEPAAPEQDPQNPDDAGQEPNDGNGTDPETYSALANEADPELPQQTEPEEPEGPVLVDGAITRASVKSMMTSDAKDRLEIVFMEIGRNDGILLHCGGEYAFIDSGMHGRGVYARNYLRSLGVTHLKYYIGTHAHNDHVGGAGPIIAGIPTDRIIVPHAGVLTMMRKKASKAEKSAINRVPCTVLRFGQSITLGGAKLLCVGPVKVKKAKSKSTKENANSLVLRVTYGNRSVLLTGDATPAELKQIRNRGWSLIRADVLKNPHHNANVKKCYPWFGMRYVVVSTTNKSKPSNSMRKKIASLGARLLNTAPGWNSHILMVTDGTAIQFFTTR